MKFVRKIIPLMLCVMLVFASTTTVSAYQLKPYKWNTSSIHYYYDNWVGARAIRFFITGVSAWNSTNADATISYGGGNFVYFCVAQSPDAEWDGMVSTYYSNGYVTSQTLTLNEGITRTWSSDGALKSVIVHEIGHVFCLGDNGTTCTIMNGYTWGDNSRYGGYSLTTPQRDDINGVNAIY